MKNALIIVDVQNDFVTGSLPVPNAKDIIKPIQNEIENGYYDYIIFTLDWHPSNHCSFKENGGIWPTHCVMNDTSGGFDFAIDLNNAKSKKKVLIWFKGLNPDVDSYSAFYDNNKTPLGFTEYLKSLNISNVFICGLAFDYCVKYTALDAQKEGFYVTVIKDLCKAVNPIENTIGITTAELISNHINICSNL